MTSGEAWNEFTKKRVAEFAAEQGVPVHKLKKDVRTYDGITIAHYRPSYEPGVDKLSIPVKVPDVWAEWYETKGEPMTQEEWDAEKLRQVREWQAKNGLEERDTEYGVMEYGGKLYETYQPAFPSKRRGFIWLTLSKLPPA